MNNVCAHTGRDTGLASLSKQFYFLILRFPPNKVAGVKYGMTRRERQARWSLEPQTALAFTQRSNTVFNNVPAPYRCQYQHTSDPHIPDELLPLIYKKHWHYEQCVCALERQEGRGLVIGSIQQLIPTDNTFNRMSPLCGTLVMASTLKRRLTLSVVPRILRQAVCMKQQPDHHVT